MARINLENKWWGDSRRGRLAARLGCVFKADGLALNAWSLAQKHWFPKRRLVPLREWQDAGLGTELMDCNLAEVYDEHFVYVKGSGEHFAWLFNQSKAGKASAAARSARYGTAQPGQNDPERPFDAGSTADERARSSLLSPPHSSLSDPSSENFVDNSENCVESSNFENAGRDRDGAAHKNEVDAEHDILREILERERERHGSGVSINASNQHFSEK